MALGLSSSAYAAKGDKTTVKLQPTNGSKVSGSAVLEDNGDGTTTVRVSIPNAKAKDVHPEHLHDGTCEGSAPSVRYPLENVVGGKSETKVPASFARLTSQKLFINLHPSPKKFLPVIACGDVSGPQALPRTGGGNLGQGATTQAFIALGFFAATLAGGLFAIARRRRA